MLRALDEFVIEGVSTTIPLIKQILKEPVFAAGEVDTRWLEREMDSILPKVV
jgi:acetyl-CoA carboxylase biotin carboxylase subunit